MAKTWRKDHFFQRAKKEKYVARAVYKLEGIDKKYRIFKKGQNVLDLGCHPGSWIQYASRCVGPSGSVVGIDLKPTDPPADNCRTIAADIYDLTPEQIDAPKESFDVVMTDMAPNTSGIKAVDQLKSAALVEKALSISLEYNKEGGIFIAKIFMGPDEPVIFGKIREFYTKAVRFKPEASRAESSESYLIGIGKKQA